MNAGEEILGKELWDQVTAEYRRWIRYDSYSSRYRQEGAPRRSIRDFLGVLSNHDFKARPGTRLHAQRPFDLGMSAREFFNARNALVGPEEEPLLALFVSNFCYAVLADLLSDALVKCTRKQQEVSGKIIATLDTDKRMALALALWEIFWLESGPKTLREYFHLSPNDSGYRAWGPSAASGWGTPLKPKSVKTATGQVDVAVARYDEETGSDVKAYEWSAELRKAPAQAVPDAVCTGMVYTLARQGGELLSTTHDLRWASDAVSDTDVSQMMAFLNQHEDAEELLELGDLCFVWLWERRVGSDKGLGLECLNAALANLKARFRRVKTLVIDVRPYQFASWKDTHEPAAIQIEKQDALEKLTLFLQAAQPEAAFKGELRVVHADDLEPVAAMAALGAADIAEFGPMPW